MSNYSSISAAMEKWQHDLLESLVKQSFPGATPPKVVFNCRCSTPLLENDLNAATEAGNARLKEIHAIYQHSECAGFVRAVKAAPNDDNPRLVFADWLEEKGDPERAYFIRHGCELAGMTRTKGVFEQAEIRTLIINHDEWVDRVVPPTRTFPGDGMIRGIAPAAIMGYRQRGIQDEKDKTGELTYFGMPPQFYALKAEIKKLQACAQGHDWFQFPYPWVKAGREWSDYFTWERGFISEIRLPVSVWVGLRCENRAKIANAHPLKSITLTVDTHDDYACLRTVHRWQEWNHYDVGVPLCTDMRSAVRIREAWRRDGRRDEQDEAAIGRYREHRRGEQRRGALPPPTLEPMAGYLYPCEGGPYHMELVRYEGHGSTLGVGPIRVGGGSSIGLVGSPPDERWYRNGSYRLRPYATTATSAIRDEHHYRWEWEGLQGEAPPRLPSRFPQDYMRLLEALEQERRIEIEIANRRPYISGYYEQIQVMNDATIMAYGLPGFPQQNGAYGAWLERYTRRVLNPRRTNTPANT